MVDRTRELLTTLQDETRPAKERVEAGNELSKLGDPRFDPGAWQLPKEDLLGFVEIPAGKFLMGSDPRTDVGASDYEGPCHEVELSLYFISRYPVTAAQFKAFVEDKNYQPIDPDCLKGLPNHPVDYVTWYDALAYCEWLTVRLRDWKKTPLLLKELLAQGWQVALPSEAEWEKAARGGLQLPRGENPHPGRIYPWGDEFDANKANSVESGIDGTSAVGCFPGGASPYGILDLSGNVWEWTRSLWGKDWQQSEFGSPYDPKGDCRENMEAGDEVFRVIRGGSFVGGQRYVRCAPRYWYNPGFSCKNHGFRLVLARALEL
jgi:formylglycine-generating enzyme required for sulfatase activity